MNNPDCKTQVLKIIINEIPKPLKRPRFNKRTGKVFNSQSKEMKATSFIIASQYSGPVLTGPLSISTTFFMPIPKSMSRKKQDQLNCKYHQKRPDIDNCEKFLLDCIVLSGNLIHDDSQFAEIHSMKIYSKSPRTQFEIRQLKNEYKIDE